MPVGSHGGGLQPHRPCPAHLPAPAWSGGGRALALAGAVPNTGGRGPKHLMSAARLLPGGLAAGLGNLAAEVRELLYKHPACAAGSHPRPRVVARFHPWPLWFLLARRAGPVPTCRAGLVGASRPASAGHSPADCITLPRLGLPSRRQSLSSGIALSLGSPRQLPAGSGARPAAAAGSRCVGTGPGRPLLSGFRAHAVPRPRGLAAFGP